MSSNDTVAPLTSSARRPSALRRSARVVSTWSPSKNSRARLLRTSTTTLTSRPTPAATDVEPRSVTFQVLAAVRSANSTPLDAVEFERTAACHQGTEPSCGMSRPTAVQRAGSIADSNRSVSSAR